jgi:hypothetical protein
MSKVHDVREVLIDAAFAIGEGMSVVAALTTVVGLTLFLWAAFG